MVRGRGRGEVKGSGEGVGERGWGKGFGFGVHAACTTKPIAASARKVGSSAAHAPSHARGRPLSNSAAISAGEIPCPGFVSQCATQ